MNRQSASGPVYTLLLCLVLLCSGTVFAQEVALQVTGLQQTYRSDEAGRVEFVLQLLPGADATVEQGVWFLNIVEPTAGGGERQVAQKLFSSASTESDTFRKVLSRAELEAGVTETLDFQFRNGAAAGEYHLALQLFSGTTTNPGRVNTDDRLALKIYPFRLEEPHAAN